MKSLDPHRLKLSAKEIVAFIATTCATPVAVGRQLPGNTWAWNAITAPSSGGGGGGSLHKRHIIIIGIVPDPFPLESSLATRD